jgi:hypothetical protein
MSVDDGQEGRFGATPDLMRSELRNLTWQLVVQMNSMRKSKGPEVLLVVLWPP